MHRTLGSAGNGLWSTDLASDSDATAVVVFTGELSPGTSVAGLGSMNKMARCQSGLCVGCGCWREASAADVCASNPGQSLHLRGNF